MAESRRRTRGELLGALVGSALVYSVLSVVSPGGVVLDGVPVSLAVGLAVPVGACFGLPGVVGITIGSLVAAVLGGSASPAGAVPVLAAFSLSFLAYLLWVSGAVSVLSQKLRRSDTLHTAVGYTVVAAISVAGGASVVGWADELLGIRPFFVGFTYAFVEFSIATFGASLLVLGAVRVSGTVAAATASAPPSDASTETSARAGLVSLPILWALLGVVGSLGFRLGRRLFAGSDRLPVEVLLDPAVFGQGGRRPQVVLGAVMLTLLSLCAKRLHDGRVDLE